MSAASRFHRLANWSLRLVGIVVLVILLTRIDTAAIWETARESNPWLLLAAFLGIIPLIVVKALRWRGIVHAQGVELTFLRAVQTYFSGLFIGLLTPGRLGEFVRVFAIKESGGDLELGFASVLADRLFDLYALVVVGAVALMSITLGKAHVALVVAVIAILTAGLIAYLHPVSYALLQRVGKVFDRPNRIIFGEGGIVSNIRDSLRMLTGWQMAKATGLTIVAYLIFYGLNYLLALAFQLPVGFETVVFATTIGSLVSFLPISVSGLGIREVSLVAYLGSAGVSQEIALGFSLLVFATFYLGGALIGAVAWLQRPIQVSRLRTLTHNGTRDTD